VRIIKNYKLSSRSVTSSKVVKSGKVCSVMNVGTGGSPSRRPKARFFIKKRTDEDEILEMLALPAEGRRINSLSRVKGHKEDTILNWLREAEEHSQAVEEVLMKDYRVGRGQLDALWIFMRNKGEVVTWPFYSTIPQVVVTHGLLLALCLEL